MEREQFTFYSSFAKAARRIRKPADRCAFYDAVVSFALTGQEPDLDNAPESVALAMELVMPVLISSRRKAENGKAKGSKAEANGSKPEANESKPEANPEQEQTGNKKEKEGEKEGEKEKENECSISPPAPSAPAQAPKQTTAGAMEKAKAEFSGDLLTAVLEWLTYKKERREPYKEVSLRALFNQIRKAADAHGDAAVIEVIRNSMASGYMGITLDKLTSPQQKRSPAYATSKAQQPLTADQWDDVLKKI